MSMLEERRGEVEDLAGGSPAGPEAADPGGGLVLPEEVLAALAGQLAARAGEPVTMTGPGGLLTGVIGQVLAAGLAAELDGHLQDGEGEPNRRNGSSLKTLNTEVGPVQVAVPRGRSGDSGS
jgi:putative transposase